MSTEFKPPAFQQNTFTCPHCGAFSLHSWMELKAVYLYGEQSVPFVLSKCLACGKYTAWMEKSLIYPHIGNAPPPHPDMPKPVLQLYEEARSIVAASPRAAAALLRVATERLVRDITHDERGNLFEIIGSLVKEGKISADQQKMLDTLRVIGNEAAHSLGEINFNEEPQTALNLFRLLNRLVERLITEPREIDEMFSKVPEKKKKAIEKRDKKV